MAEITALDFINIGKSGTFSDSGISNTTPKQVDEIFSYLTEKDIDKLLLYFHGGLVSEKNGLAAASVMMNHFTNAIEKRHALSFVWETGPKEVILQNFATIIEKTKSAFYQEALKFVIKLVARKLGMEDGKGGGGEYLADSTIEIEKQKPHPFEDLDREVDMGKGIADELTLEPMAEKEFLIRLEMESKVLIEVQASEEFKNKTTKEDPSLPPELAPDSEDAKGGWLAIIKLVAQIALNVLKRYLNKTHHDFYPTVMEETFRKLYVGGIGTWGWGRIKEKAQMMFAENDGLSGEDLHAGTYFLDALQEHYTKRLNNGKKFNIYLVGHSAGSIVICLMMKRVMEKYKDLKFETIFFLAPACRTDLFLTHCMPGKKAGFFNKFKMFTMKAENEKKDHCIPFIYTHSLLYMVSGLFEVDDKESGDIDAKILGLNEQSIGQGRYASFPELKELNAFLSDHHLILSDDNFNADLSLRSTALKHGDFDNDLPTLTAILNSL